MLFKISKSSKNVLECPNICSDSSENFLKYLIMFESYGKMFKN